MEFAEPRAVWHSVVGALQKRVGDDAMKAMLKVAMQVEADADEARLRALTPEGTT